MKSVDILLVDDNQDDIVLTQEALSEASIPFNLGSSRNSVVIKK
jgi:CheY-like chemotaxis protein